MIDMTTRKRLLATATAALLLSTPALAGDVSPLKVKYSVHSGKEKIGWSKATIEHTPKGKVITITMSVDTEILGIPVAFTTRSSTRYDASDLVTSFTSYSETPRGDVDIEATRKKGGFRVTRTLGEKTEKDWYPEESFDHVSVEPAFLEGEVGVQQKLRVLFTSSGKVRKTTMKILGRETRTILGEDRTVTHYRLKAVKNKLEEWRTDDGIIVKSLISFPLGKLTVKMLKPSP
jgi:hypothetical protein